MILEALFSMCLTTAAAEDIASLQFTGEIVSQTPYQLKFTPPAGHHFNLGAPTAVELANGSAAAQAGALKKDEHKITVDFQKVTLAKDCVVKASLYVCNDANTYCRPVRRNYECVNLAVRK
jgi:hypothetical protein